MKDADPLIQMIPIGALKPDPRNPRTISKEDFAALKASLEQFGFVQAIVVNKRNNVIVGGNQRYRAALDLGLDSVPVIWVDLEDERATTLSIGLNKISGDFDADQLAELILELDEDLLTLTGFTDDELTGLQSDPFDDEPPAESDKPKSKKFTVEQLRKLAKDKWPKQPIILEFVDWLDDEQT